MSQGTAGYVWDFTVDNGGGAVAVECDSVTFNVEFATDDTAELGDAGEENTLTAQRCSVDFSFVHPASALATGKQDVVDAFFAKAELGVVVTPAGATSGYNTYSFNGRVHNLSFTNNGTAGTVRVSGQIRNSDGGVVSVSTVA